MEKLSINPKLAKLSHDEFKKWVKQTLPEQAENWEKLYAEIGGKLPDKKSDKAK